MLKQIFGACKNYLHKTDKLLWLLTLATFSLGMVCLFSVDRTWRQGGLITHIIAAGIGLLAMFILTNIDYLDLCKAWKFYVPLVYLMVFGLFWFGKEVQGNVSWLVLKFMGREISIQPSELLKISYMLTFSLHLAKVGKDINKPLTLLLLLVHALFPIAIILRQGDAGVALIFMAMTVAMLIGCGLSLWYVIGGIGLMVPAVALAWKFDFIKDYQKERIYLILAPEKVSGIIDDFQQERGLISMGTGGMFGNGLSPENPVYVPYAQNDFIFTYVGHILGFVGCLTVVVLLAAICIKCLANASRSVTIEGRSICCAVFGMIAAQAMVNIGMCLKLFPVVGVTLPFFSQGGSSIFSVLCAMGLAISVYMHNDEPLFKLKRR